MAKKALLLSIVSPPVWLFSGCASRWKQLLRTGMAGRRFLSIPRSRFLLMANRAGERTCSDDRTWQELGFSDQMICDHCGRVYQLPEPRLYSFNSPLGLVPSAKVLATSSISTWT